MHGCNRWVKREDTEEMMPPPVIKRIIKPCSVYLESTDKADIYTQVKRRHSLLNCNRKNVD